VTRGARTSRGDREKIPVASRARRTRGQKSLRSERSSGETQEDRESEAESPKKRMRKVDQASNDIELLRNATGFSDSITKSRFVPLLSSERETDKTTSRTEILVPREDLVRVILQFLGELGFARASQALEKESGVEAYDTEVMDLRHAILHGRWDAAVDMLSHLPLRADATLQRGKFVILRQKYLELLEASHLENALACLQKELAQIVIEIDRKGEGDDVEDDDSGAMNNGSSIRRGDDETDRSRGPMSFCLRKDLHNLASLALCASANELRKMSKWDGASGSSRRHLVALLMRFLSCRVALPERRLRTLLAQACAWSTMRSQRYGGRVKKVDVCTRTATSLLMDDYDDGDDRDGSDNESASAMSDASTATKKSENGSSRPASKRQKRFLLSKASSKAPDTDDDANESSSNGHNGHGSNGNGSSKRIKRSAATVDDDEEHLDAPLSSTFWGDKAYRDAAFGREDDDEASSSHAFDGFRFRANEIVRIILQSLEGLGYAKAKASLEMESNIKAESKLMSSLRSTLLRGRWASALRVLQTLPLRNAKESLFRARFMILRQKYLELLEASKLDAALPCLKDELGPVCIGAEASELPSALSMRTELHTLTTLLLCTSGADLCEKASWDGARGRSRRTLVDRVARFVSSHASIPARRLRTLLERSIRWQISQSPYRNASGKNTFSLLVDHRLDTIVRPRRTLDVLDAHEDEVWHLVFSHDGCMLATASKDASVILWSLRAAVEEEGEEDDATGENKKDASPAMPINCVSVRQSFVLKGTGGAVRMLAWSPDDSSLLACSADNTIKLWCAKKGIGLMTFSQHSSEINACVWSPCGSRFLSAGLDKTIVCWDVNRSTSARNVDVCDRISDMVVSSDGTFALVACFDRNVHALDFESYVLELKFTESGAIMSMFLAENNRHLFLQIAHEEMRMWDVTDGIVLQAFRSHRCDRYVIRGALGGCSEAIVASGSEDTAVHLWYRETGEKIDTLTGHSAVVSSVAWNPKYKNMLASCSDDGTVRIWGV